MQNCFLAESKKHHLASQAIQWKIVKIRPGKRLGKFNIYNNAGKCSLFSSMTASKSLVRSEVGSHTIRELDSPWGWRGDHLGELRACLHRSAVGRRGGAAKTFLALPFVFIPSG